MPSLTEADARAGASLPAAGLDAGEYWRSLSRAFGLPAARGVLRQRPGDFRVRELLGFDPSGDGEHDFLLVRKESANTRWVARQLARHARVRPREVGYAGLKDRHAVAEQWFSVRVAAAASPDWSALSESEVRVLAVHRHRRKLRRGALRGNHFEILVRSLRGDRDALQERLTRAGGEGVPNYFGPQRFGRRGANLERARDMLCPDPAGVTRGTREFALSAARAFLFNAVLSRRVAAGDWNRLIPGDVANLDGCRSIFPVAEADSELQQRAAALDIHPTGPLWGVGKLPSAGRPRSIEETLAAEHAELARLLESCGSRMERRALRLRIRELHWAWSGDGLRLWFRLPPGGYATSVLRELIEMDGETRGCWKKSHTSKSPN